MRLDAFRPAFALHGSPEAFTVLVIVEIRLAHVVVLLVGIEAPQGQEVLLVTGIVHFLITS